MASLDSVPMIYTQYLCVETYILYFLFYLSTNPFSINLEIEFLILNLHQIYKNIDGIFDNLNCTLNFF